MLSRQAVSSVLYCLKADKGKASMVKYRLKEVLKEKGVSQGKLSRMADVSLSTIQRLSIEGSTYNVSMDVLERIAKALGVKISDLYEERNDE